jgi:hypothetical protein
MIGKILIARAICVGNRGFRDRELAGYKAALEYYKICTEKWQFIDLATIKNAMGLFE